ncbi:hypothetical protein [Bartonella sp. B1098]|uniref:hypothetical protein n=1 Tax=Bartonella sp. B1098 TaxID=2911421 RepID=UPI0020C58875|nr:hypothetical protein [Bartonella sp. B1098]
MWRKTVPKQHASYEKSQVTRALNTKLGAVDNGAGLDHAPLKKSVLSPPPKTLILPYNG